MFTDLQLNKNKIFEYYSPLKDYNFVLSGNEINGKPAEFLIVWNEDHTFHVRGQKDTDYCLDGITEDHWMMQAIQKTTGFKEAISKIKAYDLKMKQQIKINNPYIEGKIDENTFVISFNLESPVLEGEKTPINSVDKKTHLKILPEGTFLYIKVKKEGKKFMQVGEIKQKYLVNFFQLDRPFIQIEHFDQWIAMRKHLQTHRSFVNDIAEIVLKDSRIRVKLLVT